MKHNISRYSPWKYLAVSLTLVIMYFVMVQPAIAQVQGPIQTDEIRQAAERPNDRSREGLEMVFGGIVNDPLAVSGDTSAGGGQQTLVSNVFKTLNGIGLIVGVFLAGFVIFRKVFQAGNDGEVFKRGGENAFTILKFVWGFAALVPTASGWSMAQLVVLWCASLIGVGTANLATDSTLSAFYGGQTMALEPARPNTRSLAQSLFNANLCSIGINRGIQEAINAGANLGSEDLIITHDIDGTGFILADSSRSKVCGGATYPKERESVSSYLGFDLDPAPYRQAQMVALQQMQNYLVTHTESYANAVFASRSDTSVTIPSASLIVDAAARSYDQSLGSMNSLSDNKADEIRQKVVDSVQERGWWELGAWYNSIAQANSVVTDNMLTRANSVGQNLNLQGAVSSYYEILLSSTSTNRQRLHESSASGGDGTDPSVSGNEASMAQVSEDANQLVSKVFSVFSGKRWTERLIGMSENSNGVVNPIISMKTLGDWIMVGAETSFVGYVALKGAMGAADNVNDSLWGGVANFFTGGVSGGFVGAMSGIIGAISPFFVIAIVMLFGFGVTLSIYVPFIPFIIWYAAILNWVIFVAIGVVAAPLWAFSHLTGEDNGMGRTQHGYIFMINAMLRPVLMVAAFFIAGGIVVMGGSLLNQLFIPALHNVQANSTTGVVSIIALIGLYISIVLTLVHTSFNLIFMIPDKVIEFIGGSQLATGQGAEQEQRNAINAIAASMRHGRGGGSPGGMPGNSTPGKNSITKQ